MMFGVNIMTFHFLRMFMSNKRVGTSSDPLVLVQIKVLRSQKEFLATQEESVSAIIRKLITFQMEGHEVEIAKLKEELRDDESRINLKKATITELEASTKKQQNTVTLRDDLFKRQTEELLDILIRNGGFFGEIEDAIKFRIQGMNTKLNGTGAQPYTVDEIKQTVIDRAKSKEVKIYYARLH